MLIAIMLGCADFQGTDFRQGWTEVECDIDRLDDQGLVSVEVPDHMAGPRPTFAMTHRVEQDKWYGAVVFNVDGTTYTIATGGLTGEFDACRFWIAE